MAIYHTIGVYFEANVARLPSVCYDIVYENKNRWKQPMFFDFFAVSYSRMIVQVSASPLSCGVE